MFPKKQRISKGTFQNITSKGRRSASEHLTMTKTPIESGVLSRFAVVISKKIAPTAAARNLFRRRIYEALKKSVGNTQSASYIVFAKKNAQTLSFAHLQKEIDELIVRG